MAKSQFPYRQNGSEEPLPRESPKADDEGKPQGANRWTIGRLRVGEHVGCRLMPGAKQHPNKPQFCVVVNLHSFKERRVEASPLISGGL